MSHLTRKGGSLSDGEMGRPVSDVYFCKSVHFSMGRIATAYGLDGPGIESRWDEIFRTSPDWP